MPSHAANRKEINATPLRFSNTRLQLHANARVRLPCQVRAAVRSTHERHSMGQIYSSSQPRFQTGRRNYNDGNEQCHSLPTPFPILV